MKVATGRNSCHPPAAPGEHFEREFEQALQYRDEQVFHDTLCSLHFHSVEIGNANSFSPKGTVVSWSYNTRPKMNRLPQASASLRNPEKSVAVTVAAAFTSIPTT